MGEVALVDGEGEAAAGVDVEERLANGDVAESFVEGDGVLLAVEGDGDGVAELIAELREDGLRDIEDEVAEGTVGADDVAVEAFGIDGGGGDVEADELSDVEGGTGLGPVITASEMGAGGRKMSRPWKVEDNLPPLRVERGRGGDPASSPIIQSGLVISRAASMPSRS